MVPSIIFTLPGTAAGGVKDSEAQGVGIKYKLLQKVAGAVLSIENSSTSLPKQL